MTTVTTVEQQVFGAVEAAISVYAPELHLAVAPIEAAAKGVVTLIEDAAATALHNGTLISAAESLGKTLGTAAGTVIGAYIGGPLGASTGAVAGGEIGDLIGEALGTAFTSIALEFLASATA